MATMNISLPDTLKAEMDSRIARDGFGTSSEYVRSLIRDDLDRQRLRLLLLEGAASPLDGQANGAWFEMLRARVRTPAT